MMKDILVSALCVGPKILLQADMPAENTASNFLFVTQFRK